MDHRIVTTALVALLIVFGFYFVTNSNSKQQSNTQIVTNNIEPNGSETANWNTFSSEILKISFKYPTSYSIMDRLSGAEKVILLGDKEFPKTEIAFSHDAPITLSRYEAAKVNAQISGLSNVKKSTVAIGDGSADVVEGNYPDYPFAGAAAGNNMKIVIIPDKNLVVTARDHYSYAKSDWGDISTVLNNILGTIKFE